ncbi:hypothetical protein BMS3Abin04_02791 [bacterium BMS3Abin04]|nr:hypothetical protein BMS3Abin04_02791 [bacterium BMS3Abin04]
MRDYLTRGRTAPKILLGGQNFQSTAMEWFTVKTKSGDGIAEVVVNLDRATVYESKRFKDFVTEVIENSNKKIILNITKCKMIDSAFIGSMIIILKKLKTINGKLKLVADTQNMPVSISHTSLNEIFDIYPNTESAIFSIKQY